MRKIKYLFIGIVVILAVGTLCLTVIAGPAFLAEKYSNNWWLFLYAIPGSFIAYSIGKDICER